MQHWNLDAIPWHNFDSTKVDPMLLVLAKTASLVEYNSRDYILYLSKIFQDDLQLCQDIETWGQEERQHGLALKKWAELCDPSFDFEKSLERFRSCFRIQINAESSIRGSKARELISRCTIESGTTSFYSALNDASEEPVFKEICKRIAVDEIHHFKLFYGYLKSRLEKEKLSTLDRIKVVFSRTMEVEDDEFACAYAAANLKSPVDKNKSADYTRAYLGRVYKVFRASHLQKGLSLALMAAGIERIPRWLARLFSRVGIILMRLKARHYTLSPDLQS